MLKAIKIRLYPTPAQVTEMNKLLGACRFVYNRCLNLKIEYYKEDKTSLGTGELNKEIIKLKNTEEYIWLKEAHSKVIQQSLINLDVAYKNFFKNKKGFPKYKSKKGIDSCRFPVDAIIGVFGNRISLITKLKDIHFKCSVRDEKHLNKERLELKSATLSRTKSGQYILSVLVNRNVAKPESQYITNENMIGIDLGIKDFVITSEGIKHENIKSIRNNENKLKRLHQLLSRKQKGSNNKSKARIKLARLNEKINNKKQNYLHEVSNSLLNENQVIAMENLNVSDLMKNHKLARSIQELSLGEFKRMLLYKSDWQGKTIVEIDRWFPSSKLCNDCGYKNNNLKLKDREWVCKSCGVVHDRDYNAALNIRDEGLRLFNEEKEQQSILGLSKPELTLVESSSVDDPIRNNALKSTYSMKQEGKIVRFANVKNG